MPPSNDNSIEIMRKYVFTIFRTHVYAAHAGRREGTRMEQLTDAEVKKKKKQNIYIIMRVRLSVCLVVDP